jgi:hypothetical protein
MLVQLSFKLEGVGRFDPPEQSQLQRIPRVEVALARLDVLRHADLDRGASVFIFANEIDRHVALPAASTEPVEQGLDHFLI